MNAGDKLSRNQLCPCGSGRKYKRCCGVERARKSVPGSETSHVPTTLAEPTFGIARNATSGAHADEMTAYHLDVLFAGVTVGSFDFKTLFTECMQTTRTIVPRWKVPLRAQRALNLARYYLRSLEVDGARVECGTLRGFSALMLCRVHKAMQADFTGAGLHIVDSFEGLSEPRSEDAVRSASGELTYPAGKGIMACPMEHVQGVLADFPDVSFHKGWIPEALKALPEAKWSFVHIDVDLYAPTLGCLEYFLPRLARGGIVVNDDYASPMFPGGGIAWDEHCRRHGLAYAALDTGQAVLVNGL